MSGVRPCIAARGSGGGVDGACGSGGGVDGRGVGVTDESGVELESSEAVADERRHQCMVMTRLRGRGGGSAVAYRREARTRRR